MPRTASPFVGREPELAALLAAMQRAAAGQSAVVVVDGDAGVGKTRLLGELVRRVNEQGGLPLIGHCVSLGDAPPPYLPFIEIFGRLNAAAPQRIERLLEDFPSVARLLPRHVQDAGGARPGEDRVDRGELFEAVYGALTRLSADQPLVLVVEDVHWADQATRDLLGFLFTRLESEPVTVIVTFRSDDLHRRHPLRPTLAQWARLGPVERVHLDRLGDEDLRLLVRALHPAPMAEPDVRSIVSRADGNAFFAEELVAASEQCGDTGQLPWQLADLLLVRLERISGEAREVVRVAAVGGRRISHDALAGVVDLPPATLDGALRDAVDAHILEPTTSGRGYTFRHALLAEAIYDDLLPGERVRLHAAFATELTKRRDSSPAELARHALASHDLSTAYDASVRAGDEAMNLAAPQEAMNHYATALDLFAGAASAPEDPAPLVLALVDAAVAAGRSYRGLRLARQALATLDADAAPLTRAQLLYAFAYAAVVGETDDTPFTGTAEALRLVPADPPTPFRGKLAALHARTALMMGREVEAQRWAREAIDIAAALGSPSASSDAATTLAILAQRAEEPDQVVARLTAIADDARLAGETAVELRTRYNIGSLYYEIGELDRAQQAYEQAGRRARDSGRPWAAYGMEARAMVGLIQYVRGDWDGAVRTLDVGGENAPAQAEALFSATCMLVSSGRGDDTALQLLPLLAPWREREGRIALFSAAAAIELHEQHQRVDEAVATVEDAVRTLSGVWQDDWFLGRIRLAALGLSALATATAGQPERGRAPLAERGRALVTDGRMAAERGLPAGRRLGVEGRAWLARLEAEWARLRWLAGVEAPGPLELVEIWKGAVRAFDYGNVVEVTRCRARLAAVLRSAGDPAEAAEAADLARASARALGAEPLLAELRSLGLARSAVRTGSGPSSVLTARERDVLRLVIDGRSNRQIAAELYISEKTVSVHVSNILAKLGVSSRTEAAALARREDLLG